MSGPKDSKAEIEARRRAELERKRREEAERRARIRKLQNTLRAGLNDIEELRRSFENSRSQIAADANKLGVRVPGILSEIDFVAEKNSIVRSVDLGSNSLQNLESSIKKVERSAADLAARSADLIQQACNILRLKKKITEETESYRKVADAAASAMQELSDYSKKVEVEVPDSVAESAQTVNRDNDVKVDLDSDDPDYLSSVIGSLKKGQHAQEKQIADIAGARTAMTEQYCGRLMEEIALAGETVARELEKSRIAEENRRKQEARRQEMQKLEEARQEQQKKEKIISDIYSSVDELRSLHLDVHLRDQMLEILENTALAGYDSAFLKNYQSITVIPFIKKCRVCDAQFREMAEIYSGKKAEYEVLCEELALEARQLPCEKESIAFYSSEIERLHKLAQHRNEERYIQRVIDEVMEEMGYNVLGCSKVLYEGTQYDTLFRYGEHSAIRITCSNGQICAELGGMDVCDRDADTAEAAEQANEMKEFCDDYRIFKEKVAERCVNLTLVSELKPSPEYAQIHNLEDYDVDEETKQSCIQTAQSIQNAAAETQKSMSVEQEE